MPTEVSPPAAKSPEPPKPATAPGAVASPGAAKPPPVSSKADAAPGETPPPETPPKAKEHAAFAKAAARLREEKRQLKAEREGWTAKEKEYGQKLAALEQLSKELEVHKAERAEFLKDPIAWAEKHGGAQAEKAIQSYVDRTTPEKAIEAARLEAAEARKAAQELKELLAKRDEDEKKQRAALEEQQREATRQSACRAFVDAVTSGDNAKKFPYLNAMYEKDYILAETMKFQLLAEKNQERHTFEEVAAAFDRQAKAAYEKLQERRKALFEAEQALEPGTAPRNTNPASSRETAAAKVGPETRTTPKAEKASRVLSRKEQAERDKALLRQAMEKDSAALKTH